MPSVRYYNQTAPFWDWVADLEDQGAQHPFFNRGNQQDEESENERQQRPWAEGWANFPFGPFAYRGRHGPHGRNGPPPPPPPPGDQKMNDAPGEKEHDPEEGSSEPRGPPPPGYEESPHHGPGPHRHHGRQGSRGRCGSRGRGGFGGRGRHGPFGGGPPVFSGPVGGFGALADMFQSQLFGENNNSADKAAEDFKPDVDVFDTAETFVVHVSLPGAKKEDVGVNWDSEKSELSIAGVVYRPGDEELLKTLALDERKVGAFERKVRLGSRANPAQVDVEGISARLEDGILRVEVPKLDAGYVEVKKVDVE